jgi:esterase/lipase superfamily enzyme
MRRWLIGLGVLVAALAVWLGRPVTRAELGITPGGTAATVCRAPVVPDIRHEIREGCRDPKGCQNTEHVARLFMPFAVASLNAYEQHRRLNLDRYDPAWKRVETFESLSGLAFAVYRRESAAGVDVLVAFRGTDDWLLGLPTLNDTIANLSWVTQWVNPFDQYRQARQEFRRIREAAIAEARGRPVQFTVTGHSLGGGLAQHIARGFPCVTAVVFNSSCVSNRFRFAEPYLNSQVAHVHENRDWLSRALCLPSGPFGWGERHQSYVGNWVSDRVREGMSELELTSRQHYITPMALGMTRMVLCCAQRQRNSSHPNCACRDNVMSGVEPARRMLCEGRRPRPDLKNDPCDFGQVATRNDAQCSQRC